MGRGITGSMAPMPKKAHSFEQLLMRISQSLAASLCLDPSLLPSG
jgi:hypothetical protein